MFSPQLVRLRELPWQDNDAIGQLSELHPLRMRALDAQGGLGLDGLEDVVVVAVGAVFVTTIKYPVLAFVRLGFGGV